MQRRPAFEEQRRDARSRADRRSPAPARRRRGRGSSRRGRAARAARSRIARRTPRGVVTTQDRPAVERVAEARRRRHAQPAIEDDARSAAAPARRRAPSARDRRRGASPIRCRWPRPRPGRAARAAATPAPLIAVRAPGRRRDGVVEADRDLGDDERPAGARRWSRTPRSAAAPRPRGRRPRPRRRDRAGRRSRGRRPRGYGSCIAATTRRMPASATATAHGPVRPV